MKRRILFLNPPGRKNYGRDYLLGSEQEAGLRLPPLDLVQLSGALPPEAEAVALDAMAEGLSPEQAWDRAERARPTHVVFLTSAASYAEDTAFLRRLKALCPRARFIGMGDVYRDIRALAFSLHEFLDSMILDFTAAAPNSWLEDGGAGDENVLRRDGRGGAERHHDGEWEPSLPRWELFALDRYRWPLGAAGPAASLLTEFGCPYLCSYCPSGTLGYKWRPASSVLAEARKLKSLGARSVFIRDQTFGLHRRRTLELLEGLDRLGLGFSWVCTTRVDLADAEFLERFHGVGGSAVAFGIDSGDDEVLRAYKKNTTRAQAARAVEAAHRAGLKAWGIFLIGLSMDTRESVERTLRLAAELPLDHVSLRVEAQRYAADYRREMLVRGLVPPEAMPPDVPTSVSVWQGRLGLSNEDAFRYHRQALQDLRKGVPARPASR